MTNFKIAQHSRYGYNIVEILDSQGKVIGVVYPDKTKENGVKIISAHMNKVHLPDDFDGIAVEDPGTVLIPIPSINIEFKPAAWTIQDGRLLKPSSN